MVPSAGVADMPKFDHPKMSRAAEAATRLTKLARTREPGSRLGTKAELRRLCDVSVGTFNEALKLAQARGTIVLRPGPGGGLFVGDPSPMVQLGNSLLALDAEHTSVAAAMRLRNALDPLLVEDALNFAMPDDHDRMRQAIEQMKAAVDDDDALAFIRANWHLHAVIAEVSPEHMLKSIYLTLLHIVEEHTLSVQPTERQTLPEFIADRLRLHSDLVTAIVDRDSARARKLIIEHDTDRTH